MIAPERKKKPVHNEDIQSFGAINMKKGPELGVLDAQGSFSGNTYIQRSSGMFRKRNQVSENSQEGKPTLKWWPLKANLSSIALDQPSPKIVLEEEEEVKTKGTTHPNVKKLIFKKTTSTNNLLQFHGKLVLRDLNQEKVKDDLEIVKIDKFILYINC